MLTGQLGGVQEEAGTVSVPSTESLLPKWPSRTSAGRPRKLRNGSELWLVAYALSRLFFSASATAAGTLAEVAGSVLPPSDAAFEVDGTFTCETFRRNVVARHSDRLFHVRLRPNQWQIVTAYHGVTNEVKNFEASFDGINLYTLTSFDTNRTGAYRPERTGRLPMANQERVAPPQPKNDSVAVVQTKQIPDFDVSLIQFIWLAYCSASYFSNLTDSRVPPIGGIGWTPAGDFPFLTAKLTRLDGSLALPREIVFWNEGKAVLLGLNKGATNWPSGQGAAVSVRTVLADAPKPYDQGFTNAIYQVLETTAVGGCVIPTHFILRVFRTKVDGRSTADLSLSMVVEGRARLARELAHGIRPPEIGPRTLVNDKRTGVVYWGKESRWLSPKEARAASGPARPHLPVLKVALQTCLLALTLGFGAIMWAVRKRS